MNKFQKGFTYTGGIIGSTSTITLVGVGYLDYILLSHVPKNTFTNAGGGKTIAGLGLISLGIGSLGAYIGYKLGYVAGTFVSNIYDKYFPKNISDIDVENNNQQQIPETTPLLTQADIASKWAVVIKTPYS